MKSFRYKNTRTLKIITTRATAVTRTRPSRMASPRGAALVTAMLVTLVLSGLGLIALHSVNDTTWKTANYRSRQQASQVSDAVANLAVYRLGDSGATFFKGMDDLHTWEKDHPAELGITHAAPDEIKTALYRRGPYLIIARTPKPNTHEHSISYLFTGKEDENASEQTGGIFDDALQSAGSTSFSAQSNTSSLDVNYRLIIRDELDGPPATGFDNKHCFKKVTVASHSHVAPNLEHQAGEESWKSKTNNATNRNVIETMVGPVPCGNN